jgi:O-antigen biosynthesis protein WbqP
MYIDTPSLPTHEVAKSAVTPFGRFLRRFKLDELPQLWNVARGEMSLVGPRPCLPTQEELARLRRDLGVFEIRPGVTGLAQIRGIDMSRPEACARADAEYAARRSLTLDLRVITATLFPQAAGRL